MIYIIYMKQKKKFPSKRREKRRTPNIHGKKHKRTRRRQTRRRQTKRNRTKRKMKIQRGGSTTHAPGGVKPNLFGFEMPNWLFEPEPVTEPAPSGAGSAYSEYPLSDWIQHRFEHMVPTLKKLLYVDSVDHLVAHLEKHNKGKIISLFVGACHGRIYTGVQRGRRRDQELGVLPSYLSLINHTIQGSGGFSWEQFGIVPHDLVERDSETGGADAVTPPAGGWNIRRQLIEVTQYLKYFMNNMHGDFKDENKCLTPDGELFQYNIVGLLRNRNHQIAVDHSMMMREPLLNRRYPGMEINIYHPEEQYNDIKISFDGTYNRAGFGIMFGYTDKEDMDQLVWLPLVDNIIGDKDTGDDSAKFLFSQLIDHLQGFLDFIGLGEINAYIMHNACRVGGNELTRGTSNKKSSSIQCFLNAYVTRNLDTEGDDESIRAVFRHRQALEYKFKDLGIETSLDFALLLNMAPVRANPPSNLMEDYLMCYENLSCGEMLSRLVKRTLRGRFAKEDENGFLYTKVNPYKGELENRLAHKGLRTDGEYSVLHTRLKDYYYKNCPPPVSGQEIEGPKEVPDGLNLASSPDLPEYNFIMNLLRRGSTLTMIPPEGLAEMKTGEPTTMNLVKSLFNHDHMFSIHPSEGGHEIRQRKPDEAAGKSIKLVEPYVNSTETGLQFKTEEGLVDVIVNEVVASTWIRGCYELLAGVE